MPTIDPNIEAINKRVAVIEKSLDSLPIIERRVKSIEEVNLKLIQATSNIDIISKKVDSIDKSLSALSNIEQRVQAVEDDLKKFPESRAELEKLRNENLDLKKMITIEQDKTQSISKDYVKLQELHKAALDELDFLKKDLTTIKFDTLTGQFRDAVKTFNDNVATDNSQPYFLDSLDLEIKTGLQYGTELKLLQPLPDKLSPDTLSTIKFSLKPKTNLKITD